MSFSRVSARLRARLPFRDPSDAPVSLISGSGRSGTTWLAELTAPMMNARLVFEPFRPGAVTGLDALKNRHYLRPDSAAPQIEAAVDRIIGGQMRSTWSDRYNNQFRYQARLIKEIRVNLMLGWLLQRYPRLKIAHVIRNPFATVASQRKGGWVLELDKFRAQGALIEDHLGAHMTHLERTYDEVERGFMHWIIENYVPLMQAKSGRWPSERFQVFSYDGMVRDEAEMGAFLEFFGLSPDSGFKDRMATPSRVSRGQTSFGGRDHTGAFAAEQVACAQEMLAAFDMSDWVEA